MELQTNFGAVSEKTIFCVSVVITSSVLHKRSWAVWEDWPRVLHFSSNDRHFSTLSLEIVEKDPLLKKKEEQQQSGRFFRDGVCSTFTYSPNSKHREKEKKTHHHAERILRYHLSSGRFHFSLFVVL